MKFLNSKAGQVAVGVIAAGLVLAFVLRRSGSAIASGVGSVGDAVNPTNQDNIFARGVDQLGDVIDDGDDDDSFSLGSFLFDLFNPEYDPNAPTVKDNDFSITEQLGRGGI